MIFSFDIGGVISRQPAVFRELIRALQLAGHDVRIITDMDLKTAVKMLSDNGFTFIPADHIHFADYGQHGDLCKAVLLKKLGVDVHFDDHMGYIMEEPGVGMLVMPRPGQPYYAADWDIARCPVCGTPTMPAPGGHYCSKCKQTFKALTGASARNNKSCRKKAAQLRRRQSATAGRPGRKSKHAFERKAISKRRN